MIKGIKDMFIWVKNNFLHILMTYLVYLMIIFVAGFIFKMVPNSVKAFNIYLLLAFALSLLTRVIFAFNPMTSLDVNKLKNKNEELEKENSKLKFDIKNQMHRFLDMKSICEINIAEFKDEYTKRIDYFLNENGEPQPWQNKPRDVKSKSKRAIGLLSIMHTVKIGIDLRDVLVYEDKNIDVVLYRMSAPKITGLMDIKPEWAIKLGLEYVRPGLIAPHGWLAVDDKSGKELAIFGKETEEAVSKISSGEYKVQPRIAQILTVHAKNRVEQMIYDMLGKKAQQDDSISDASPRLVDYLLSQKPLLNS